MKLPILLASALLAGTFTFGTASAMPLSAAKSLKNVSASQIETVRYVRHRHHWRYAHRGYRSFAFAPRLRANRNFGAARSCNTIRPWKDEAYNSAYPSWRCQ